MFSKILNALENRENSDSSSADCFYAACELNPESFHVEVEGIVEISFPLDQATIQKLKDLSSEAKYGLREKTLLDKTVRHTHEITADKLSVKYAEEAFSSMLKRMRAALGLSENAKLTAHLHNMLIYEPGQFFKEHQDSEKLEGMIASLVIVLPCAHIGGTLIVHHNNKSYRFSTENLDTQSLQCLAFYADCHHEVKKLKQGHRIALTYNLVLESNESIIPPQDNKLLELALKEYFALDENLELGNQQFIYFLDHSYTEHSLRWGMLKGADRQNALDFRQVAKDLGLIPHLALVEIHESWAAEGDERDPEPCELIDDSTSLSYWLDANDNKLPYGDYSISNDDVCWTKETHDCKPFETEYEGYMGNYGNTVDYWYRRAAIVLWPATDQIVMDFKLNYEEAFQSLMALTHYPGNEKTVLDIINRVGTKVYGNSDFKSLAQLALYVQDQEVAEFLLTAFALNIFEGEGLKEFVKLQDLYGVPWCCSLMEQWKSRNHSYRRSNAIDAAFDQVVHKLLAAEADRNIILWLLNNQINYVIEKQKKNSYDTPIAIKKATPKRITTLKHLINSCDLLQDELTKQKLVGYVISHANLYPEADLASMIIEADAFVDNSHSCYTLLRDHVTGGIWQELDTGIRDPNDWSITARLGCDCNLCKVASAFLASKTESTKVWPIVMHDRDHVMSIFNRFDLPIELSVVKQGSPHKLVMVKSDKLYQLSKERFETLSNHYEKLMSSEGSLQKAAS